MCSQYQMCTVLDTLCMMQRSFNSRNENFQQCIKADCLQVFYFYFNIFKSIYDILNIVIYFTFHLIHIYMIVYCAGFVANLVNILMSSI